MNITFVMTERGQGIKFKTSKNKGLDYGELIKIPKGDKIVMVVSCDDKKMKEILYVTMKGWASRFLLSDIKIKDAGGVGVKCAKITPKTGRISDFVELSRNKKLLAITGHDEELGFKSDEVPLLRRGDGIRLFKITRLDG